MFRVLGHEKIWVLDGGLPRWRALEFDVVSSASSDAILKSSAASEAVEKVYKGHRVCCVLLIAICMLPLLTFSLQLLEWIPLSTF